MSTIVAGTTTEIACRRLFDGTRVQDDVIVRVEGDRIAAVEPLDAASRDSERIQTAFLMPGLIEGHGHASGYREGPPMGAPFDGALHFLRLCALNGVTSIRDTGNSLETLQYLQLWGAKHGMTRIFGSGPVLDMPPVTWPFSRVVRDADEARVQIERLDVEGVDFVKAYARITPEVLAAIVDNATARGLPVAIDCHATTARAAAGLGVRSIEHAANLLDESMVDGPLEPDHGPAGAARRWAAVDVGSAAVAELVALLRERGTFVCPTLLVSRRWTLFDEMVSDPYLEWMIPVMPYHRYLARMRGSIGMRVGRRFMARYMPIPNLDRDERREVEAGLDRQAQMAAALVEGGVRVVAGTDTPNPSLTPGFSLAQELAAMVAAGISETEALTAATSRTGELLGRDDLGVVRPGAQADLLLLGEDATHDIGALRAIERVMCRGRWVDRDALTERLQQAIKQGTSDG